MSEPNQGFELQGQGGDNPPSDSSYSDNGQQSTKPKLNKKYLPFIIGGGVGLVILFIYLRNKSSASSSIAPSASTDTSSPTPSVDSTGGGTGGSSGSGQSVDYGSQIQQLQNTLNTQNQSITAFQSALDSSKAQNQQLVTQFQQSEQAANTQFQQELAAQGNQYSTLNSQYNTLNSEYQTLLAHDNNPNPQTVADNNTGAQASHRSTAPTIGTGSGATKQTIYPSVSNQNGGTAIPHTAPTPEPTTPAVHTPVTPTVANVGTVHDTGALPAPAYTVGNVPQNKTGLHAVPVNFKPGQSNKAKWTN